MLCIYEQILTKRVWGGGKQVAKSGRLGSSTPLTLWLRPLLSLAHVALRLGVSSPETVNSGACSPDRRQRGDKVLGKYSILKNLLTVHCEKASHVYKAITEFIVQMETVF